jgi:hypothetical protein
VKGTAATVALIVFGWALVTAADARHDAKPAQVAYQVVTVTAPVQDVGPVETPYADSLTDVEEAERQGGCLWEWMREQQVEFTLESVVAAGYWTDTLGGACYLIGEDDE